MSPPVKRISWLFIVPFLLLGLVGTAIGVGLAWSSWSNLCDAQRTEGAVVELARVEPPKNPGKGQPPNPKPGFAPVVQYHVGDQTYRIRGKVSSSSPAYTVGEKVNVLYPVDKPADGRIDSFAENWLAPLAFGGGGLLFSLVGFGMLLSRVRSDEGKVS
jgi:hypothetical protein